MGRLTEKRLYKVPQQLFTANGSATGHVSVLDASLFTVGQIVKLLSNTQPALELKVKRIPDATTVIVGPAGQPVQIYSDVSAYLLADTARIFADEQPRPSVPQQEVERNTYQEEPAVARRSILVDKLGNVIDSDNPLPVDATITVVAPPITVDIDALTPPTKPDPDNILIVGSEDGTKAGIKHAVKVKPDGTVVVDGSATVQPVSVVGGTISADLDAFSATPDNVMLVGTEDGTKTGVKRGIINNLRQQILATHDRNQDITYADFGTKNQRITQIDYTSSTFPGITARKTLSYTLVGNRYRRDSIDWTIA